MIYTFSKLGTWGALGNQLFEIAGVIGEAIKDGADARFPDWYYKKFFDIPEEYFEPIPEGEKVVDFFELPQPCNYMQDLKHWFSRAYMQVTDALSFSDEAWELFFKTYPEFPLEDTVGVHVRRGNNLQLPDYHPVCDIEYFENALKLVAPYKHMIVASDDLDWCKQQPLFANATFAKGNDADVNIYDLTGPVPLALDTAFIDFMFLAQADSLVISNSSYSWWAAMLSYSPDVVYPGSKWYGPKLDHIDISNLFPENWKSL